MTEHYQETLAKLTVRDDTDIQATMRAIDQGAMGIAFIVDAENRFTGLVTDGDIRRALLRGLKIETPVREIVNTTPITFRGMPTEDEMLATQYDPAVNSRQAFGVVLKVPVLDEENRVTDLALLYHSGEKPSLLSRSAAPESKPVHKVLVLGGAGYLGSVLVHRLLDRGYAVTCLDNLTYGDEGIHDLRGRDGFSFVDGDIRDVRVLLEAVKGCDAAVLLAAIVGDPACQLDAEETIGTNYLATKTITDVCKYFQINRFIFASTCSVYGASDQPGQLLKEDSPLRPVSLYAEMKIRSERAILEAIDGNFSPTILRMATLYGLSPRMRFDLVVNVLTANAVRGGKISIFGGNQWRPLLHVRDAADAYIKCLESPIERVRGQVFNVGSNEQNVQIKALGHLVEEVIPGTEVEERTDVTDTRDYSTEFEKITGGLGYAVNVSIKDGIREIRAELDNGTITDHKDRKYSNYESLLGISDEAGA